MKISDQQTDLKEKYWDGRVNFICRLWFYFIRGLEIFDRFKYFFIAFGGLYYLVGKNHVGLVVLALVVGIPIILLIGVFSVHKLGSVIDYLTTKFAMYSTNRQVELLEEIKELLKKGNHGH